MLRRHSNMHCKGAPSDSPVTDNAEQARGTGEAASFTRPVSSNKPAASASEQQFSTMMPAPDHMKLTKPHLSAEAVYGPYLENGNMSAEMSRGMVERPFLPPTDNPCSSPTDSNRPNSGSYRLGEGQVISSVTLWGLAMKTLQSDNDME